MRLESSIERGAVARALNTLGLMLVKMSPDGSTGWPDRLAILPRGRVVWFEFKRPGEDATLKQKYVHAQLRALGHEVHVVTDADTVLRILKEKLK